VLGLLSVILRWVVGPMMCERCHNEATVHVSEPANGAKRDLHLCAQCARQAGVAVPEPASAVALDAVIQGLIVAHVGEAVGELAELSCPDCGMKFMEFRSGGRLGCPLDYWIFSSGLTPLLQRYHGTTRHIGKTARRREGALDRLRLRTRLRDAIAHEQYEEAARLRDLLRLKDSHA
jgi:protein arginine kinase activator